MPPLVGFITGAGEAVALVLRPVSGRISDRTGRQWAITIAGYCHHVRGRAVARAGARAVGGGGRWSCSERLGKAIRTPARDTMLAQASADLGRGRAFALHEAMDQAGAVLGPLLVALMLAVGSYELGFGVLAIPAIAAIAVLLVLRRAVPRPAAYEGGRAAGARRSGRLPRRFWLYAAFTAISVAGFATFGVLAYHLQARHVVPRRDDPPDLRARRWASTPLAALGSGWVYDRSGLRGLVVVPLLTAVVPFLSFSTSVPLVDRRRRRLGRRDGHPREHDARRRDRPGAGGSAGTGYGTFSPRCTAWPGWPAARSSGPCTPLDRRRRGVLVVAVQVAALVAFVPLWRDDRAYAADPTPGSRAAASAAMNP